MVEKSTYVARTPDAAGRIHYSAEEDAVWRDLMHRQRELLPGRAAPEWVAGLERLELPRDRVPQPREVSAALMARTGWQVEPVPALIPIEDFFELLAERRFPAASFIRTREDFDYLEEPDIFHEIFGHTPLLTDERFAEFTYAYGKAGLAASPEDRTMLERLYWFTVEFGLMRTPEGLRSYGAGINSSPGELVYAVESDVPRRVRFDPVEVLRTPYRIDIFQPVYFVIDSLDALYDLAQRDLLALIRRARRLGMHPPSFPPAERQAS